MANQNVKKLVNPTKVITGVNTRLSMQTYGILRASTVVLLSTAYLSSFRSQIPRQSTRSMQQSRQLMRMARASLKVMASLFLLLPSLRHLFATVILRDLMTKLTEDATSSTQTLQTLLALQMLTDSLSLRDLRFTPVYMQEHPSISTLSIAMVTRVLLVVLTIFRRFVTVNLLAASPELKMILLQQMTMMISSINLQHLTH